jgi:hypothetical protein
MAACKRPDVMLEMAALDQREDEFARCMSRSEQKRIMAIPTASDMGWRTTQLRSQLRSSVSFRDAIRW